jgi:hypothetical protein
VALRQSRNTYGAAHARLGGQAWSQLPRTSSPGNVNAQTRKSFACSSSPADEVDEYIREGKLALIEITASETLYELTPEIESIKANAMNADNKYQPGDWVGGY